MAIIPITIDNLENFTLTANPVRKFSSSSNGGATGSLKIFSRASPIEKETVPLEDYGAEAFGIADIESMRFRVIRDTSFRRTSNRSVFYSTSSITSSFYTGSNNLSRSDNMDWTYFSTASMMKVGKDTKSLKPNKSMFLVFRGAGEVGQIATEETGVTNTAEGGKSTPASRYLVTSQSYGGIYRTGRRRRRFLSRVEVTYEYMYSGSLRPGGNQGTVDLMTNLPEDPAHSGDAGEILYFEKSKTGLPDDWTLIHTHSVASTTAGVVTPVTASIRRSWSDPGPWYFRWIQKKYSGAPYDHWAVANVDIRCMKRYTSGAIDISNGMEEYMSLVNSASASPVRQKRVEVIRFEPSFKYTKDTGRKRVVRNILFPHYRNVYPSCHWAYPNYHTLNFFTSSMVPSTSVLMYPCQTGSAETGSTDNFPYSSAGPFTFEFWINPRYTTDQPHTPYQAGTLFHLSSSYAISLVTGSSKDINGHPDRFRILLQLSQSADIAPHSCSLKPKNDHRGLALHTFGKDESHVYVSSDNSLKRNNWHHVAISWGGLEVNDGKGYIAIDGNHDASFTIPSASIMPQSFQPPHGDPDALFVGNYFHGNQDSDRLGSQSTGRVVFTAAGASEGSTIKIIANDVDRTERIYTAKAANNFSAKNSRGEYAPEFRGSAAVAGMTAAIAGENLKDAINSQFGHLNKVTATHNGSGVVSLTQASQALQGDRGNTEISVTGSNITRTSFTGGGVGGAAIIAQFFNVNTAHKDGIVSFFGENAGPPDGASQEPTHNDPNEIKYELANPLNAEVHELRIWNSYRDLETTITGSKKGLTTLPSDLIFYLPPYFVKETKQRDVLQTPFQSTRGITNDPFNVAMSFGIGGREINVENFTREFVLGTRPRLFHLTSSEIPTSEQIARTANEYLYRRPSLCKRNLTVLPNDNGKFAPGYELLASGTVSLNPLSGSEVDRFVNDFGTLNYGFITLNDMVSTASLPEGLIDITSETRGTILNELEGAAPEELGVAPGNILTVLNRTRDSSSNEVVFFDTSNLFYGNKIRPESFSIEDPNLSGSGGPVKMKLKDNGQGGLYRADCEGPHAKWNAVGSLIYEEGIAVIKSPNIPFFGKDEWKVEFEGEHNIHVLEVNIPCPKGTVNSSSNPNWKPYAPTSYDTENADQFSYITGINLHDENFNVVARANLAQPVVKRDSDGYLFRMRIDF